MSTHEQKHYTNFQVFFGQGWGVGAEFQGPHLLYESLICMHAMEAAKLTP